MLQTIKVSEYESLLPSLVEVYKLEADDFQAGQLPYFVNEWRALTLDTEILKTVTQKQCRCLALWKNRGLFSKQSDKGKNLKFLILV